MGHHEGTRPEMQINWLLLSMSEIRGSDVEGKPDIGSGLRDIYQDIFPDGGLEGLLLVSRQPLHACFPAQPRGCLLQHGKKAADRQARCGSPPAETIQEPDGGFDCLSLLSWISLWTLGYWCSLKSLAKSEPLSFLCICRGK